MARILLIEDDGHVRATLRRLLEQTGHTVIEAADGRVGLRLYQTKPADLVITDILMPEQDGLETILRLRKDFPEVKIIAITGGGQTGRRDFLYVAKRLGAQYTFRKPLDPGELIAAIHALLQG